MLSNDTPTFLHMMVKILFKVNSAKPNCAFYPHNDKPMLLFSGPMRDRATSALREMFLYYSLGDSITLNEGLSKSKTREGMVELTYSEKK